MRNLRIVRKNDCKPAYKSPLYFCEADQSSLIVIDNDGDNSVHLDANSGNGGTRLIRLFPGKQDVQELHRFSEHELELLHPVDKPNAIQISYSRPNDTIYMATQAGGFYQFPIGSEGIEELFIAPSGISTYAVSPDSRYLALGTVDETLILFSLPDLEMLATIELTPQKEEQESDIRMNICWRQDSRYFAVCYIFQGIRKTQVYDETGALHSTTEDSNPIPKDSNCLAWQPSGGLIATLGISPATNNSENVSFFELNGLKRADFNPFEGRTSTKVQDQGQDKSRVLDIRWNSSSDVIALRKEDSVELWVRANYVWMCKQTLYSEEKDGTKVSFVGWDAELPYRLHLVFDDGLYYVRDFSFEFSTGLSAGSALTVSINGPQLYCTPFRDTSAPPPNCRFQANVGDLIQEVVISNFWDGFFTVLSTGTLVFFKYNKKTNSLVKVATAEISQTTATSRTEEKQDPPATRLNSKACYNWIWLNKSQISCISTNGSLLTFELSNNDFLQDNQLDVEAKIISLQLQLQSSLSVRGKLILCIFKENIETGEKNRQNEAGDDDDSLLEKVETRFLLVQKRCGAILLQELGVMPNILLGRLPDSVQQLKYIVTEDLEKVLSSDNIDSNSSSGSISENSLIVLGLDPLTRTLHALYKSVSLKVLSDCTSIEIFGGAHILATTTQGSLEVVHVKDLLNFFQNQQQQQQQNQNYVEKIELNVQLPVGGGQGQGQGQLNQLNAYSRKVEKGSVIVNCCWNRILEPSLTLQIIPRGNLETISPRPLIISSLALLLKRKKYNQVMIAMRRHRLDFNVLAQQLKDLSRNNNNNNANVVEASLLRAQLSSILEDVQDSHTLVLMVTELGAEHLDVVKLMKEILESKLTNIDGVHSNQGIINPYLAVMAKLNLYEQVLHSPLISGDEGEAATTNNREVIKGRIKFLSFYCDNPEILYESALGTYDLNLTSLVADCLNKDPKEYLPILNEYKSFSEPKLKFTVDNKLKKFSSAIVHLLQQKEQERIDSKESSPEIIKYIERHRIHPAAIKYLETKQEKSDNDRDLLTQIYSSYASYFEEQRKLAEAGLCYSRAKNYDKGFECYSKCGKWIQAVLIVQQQQKLAGMNKEKAAELYRQLVLHLDNLKDFEAAGQVLENYLADKREAFTFFVKARNWDKAKMMVMEESVQGENIGENSRDLSARYETELREAVKTLEETCESVGQEISRYTVRLAVVRKKKEEREANAGFGYDQDNFSDTESVSTTTSFRSSAGSFVSTLHSGKTHRSGKNVRKHKRKLFSLKEGSKFEDVAIVIHVWELITTRIINEIKPEIEGILPSLWEQRVDDEAAKIVADFDTLLKEVDSAIKEVWPTILPQQENLEFKYCVPPPGWSTSWNKIIL